MCPIWARVPQQTPINVCKLLKFVRMNLDEIHSIRTTPSIHKGTPVTQAYVKRTYSDVFSGLDCIGDPEHTKLNQSMS